MRRKFIIALLGLGVIAGFGGEFARWRYDHRGGAPFARSCHRESCCRGGHSEAAPPTASTELPPTPPAK
jgi:hypothetical protein